MDRGRAPAAESSRRRRAVLTRGSAGTAALALFGGWALLPAALATASLDTSESAAAVDARGLAAAPVVAPENPVVDPLDAELDAALDPSFPDPLEETNRGIFAFNQGVDEWVVDPVSTVYGWIIPESGRDSIRRALVNLDSPATFVNQILQGRAGDAGMTLLRFCINTTIGLGGLADPATHFGLEGEDADFGQTLATWGTDSGPYLVMPLLGPSTARDGVGTVVDFFLEPTTWFLTPASHLYLSSVEGTVAGIDRRFREGRKLEALRESSVDYYAAMRNAYSQYRKAEIAAGKADDSGPLVTSAGAGPMAAEPTHALAAGPGDQGAPDGASLPASASATLASALDTNASKP